MAEFVLKRTEESIPEYEQMLRIGLFNKDEVKAVIKKTMSYEYKLVRRVKVKKDFLACIQHKIHLLALIKKRRKRIGYFLKKDEIEYEIVRRIHGLFKQCTFRWPDDLQLWLSHVEFCKEWNKKTQLSKIWTAMLQLHGNSNINLWAMAAKWELEDHHSVENARQIFLRGIRHFPDETKLWHEYFRMELIHCMKMRERLALLKEGEEHDLELSEEHLKGDAALIVYNNAIEQFPNDSKCKCVFLEIALIFSFFAGEIINTIIQDILEQHTSDPHARSALAKLHLNPNVQVMNEKDATVMKDADEWTAEKRCWEDFETAVHELGTLEMWQEYVFFLSGRIEKNKLASPYSRKRQSQLFVVLERGHGAKKLTTACYIKYIEHLFVIGDAEKAVNVLEESPQLSDSVELQLRLLAIISKRETSFGLVRDVVVKLSTLTSMMDSGQEKRFCTSWIEFAMETKDEDYALEALQLAKKRHFYHLEEMTIMFLDWKLESTNLDDCYELYETKLKLICPSSFKLLSNMVAALKGSPSACINRITQCYENSVDNLGKTEPNFWLDYIKHMLAVEPTSIGMLHWKAMKTLDPSLVDEFTEKYALSQIVSGRDE